MEILFEIICLCIYFVLSAILTFLIMFYYTKNMFFTKYWSVYIYGSLVLFVALFAMGTFTVDVSSAFYYGDPFGYVNGTKNESIVVNPDFLAFSTSLEVIWNVIYWFFWTNSWIIAPILCVYVKLGNFNFLKRLLMAIYENLVSFGVYVVLFAIAAVALVVYLIIAQIQFVWSDIKAIIVSLSNTYGFVILVICVGIGFGSIPMNIFRISNHSKNKCYLEYQSVSIYRDLTDERDEIYLLGCNLVYLEEQCSKNKSLVKEAKWCKSIHSSFENDDLFKNKKFVGSAPQPECKNENDYENLHREVKGGIGRFKSINFRWKSLCREYFVTSDVCESSNSSNKVINHNLSTMDDFWYGWIFKVLQFLSKYSKIFVKINNFLKKVEWVFYYKIWIFFYYFLFGFVIIMFSILFYCEVTPFIQLFDEYLDLSIISILFRAIRSQKWMVLIGMLVFLGSEIYVISYGMIKIRFFSFINVFEKYFTDPDSLLSGLKWISRILPSLFLNMSNNLGISKKDSLAYFKVNSNSDDTLSSVSWIWFGNYIGAILPLFIPVIVVLIISDVINRVLKIFGIMEHRFVFNDTCLCGKNDPNTLKQGRRNFLNQKKRIIAQLKKEKDEKDKKNKKNNSVNDYDDDDNEDEADPDIKVMQMDDILKEKNPKSDDKNKNNKKDEKSKNDDKNDDKNEDKNEAPPIISAENIDDISSDEDAPISNKNSSKINDFFN